MPDLTLLPTDETVTVQDVLENMAKVLDTLLEAMSQLNEQSGRQEQRLAVLERELIRAVLTNMPVTKAG